jgi:succinoglycan biosynthesis protein ExoM
MGMQELVSVCVCTYKRPAGLREVLDALGRQKGLDGFIEVVVVDNDATGSAKQTVDDFRSRTSDPPVRYFVEPQQNIALARNRSVFEARGQWVAFIDDDEFPEPSWLSELLATALRYEADGVFAPVIPILPKESPPWISRGRFFEKRPQLRSGEAVSAGGTRTSNALVRASALKQRGELFDARWGLTGGSDYHLFSDMLASGSYFVWCNEAIVHERVPSTRANIAWLLKRSIRGGQIYADRKIAVKGKRVYWELITRGMGALGLSLLVAPLMLPFGVHRSVWWLKKGAHGIGFLVALSDFRYEPYRA